MWCIFILMRLHSWFDITIHLIVIKFWTCNPPFTRIAVYFSYANYALYLSQCLEVRMGKIYVSAFTAKLKFLISAYADVIFVHTIAMPLYFSVCVVLTDFYLGICRLDIVYSLSRNVWAIWCLSLTSQGNHPFCSWPRNRVSTITIGLLGNSILSRC